MVRVNLWLQLLLVILILRQSAAVSGHCSELQEEISGLKEDIVKIRDLKRKEELRADNCTEQLQTKIDGLKKTVDLINQAVQILFEKQEPQTTINGVAKTVVSLNQTSQLRCGTTEDEQLQTTNDGLTKTVDSINQAVQILVEKQEQLQTTNDGLTKTVASINHAVQKLFQKQTQLQTNIDGLTKRVELLNEMSQLLCDLPKDVCRSLLVAAKSGDVDSAKRLVKCDSNDSCTDYDERRNTPLTYAAKKGHLEVVRVLLEGGANVHRTDVIRNTALHEAAWNGRLDICRLLLDWGAKVNALNDWQHTPLRYAAYVGHLSVVKLLVERGADVSVKDDNGRKASEVARSEGKKDVADWLDSVRRG